MKRLLRDPVELPLQPRRRYLVPNSIVVTRGCPQHCDFCYKEAFFQGGRGIVEVEVREVGERYAGHLGPDHDRGGVATDRDREVAAAGRAVEVRDREPGLSRLVARGDRNGICMAVIPGNAELDLKALAAAAGDRTPTTAAPRTTPDR